MIHHPWELQTDRWTHQHQQKERLQEGAMILPLQQQEALVERMTIDNFE